MCTWNKTPLCTNCPGMWDISHHKTWSVHGKFDFFPPGIVHSLCLFCEGHETRRQACLLLKESMFVANMFEKPFKNNPFFFLSKCFVRLPSSIETGWSITYVRVTEDKTDEGRKLHLKFVETIQLLVLWGLRKFQVRVRSPHFFLLFLSIRGALISFQPGHCTAKL